MILSTTLTSNLFYKLINKILDQIYQTEENCLFSIECKVDLLYSELKMNIINFNNNWLWGNLYDRFSRDSHQVFCVSSDISVSAPNIICFNARSMNLSRYRNVCFKIIINCYTVINIGSKQKMINFIHLRFYSGVRVCIPLTYMDIKLNHKFVFAIKSDLTFLTKQVFVRVLLFILIRIQF